MTNALPAGTRNTSLNLIDEEYQILSDISGGKLGPTIKKYYLLGLKAAGEAERVAAAQIEVVRAERLRLKHGIVTMLVFGLILQFFARDINANHRTSRRRRDEMELSFSDTWTADPFDAFGEVAWASITEIPQSVRRVEVYE